jgi:hypothetical protein
MTVILAEEMSAGGLASFRQAATPEFYPQIGAEQATSHN